MALLGCAPRRPAALIVTGDPMRTSKTAWRLAALALGLFVLAGCNTIQGAGKDIKRAGEKIEEAARR